VQKRFRRLGAFALAALVSLFWLSLAAPVHAAPPPLAVDAKSAILLDFTTGQVLFEKNADMPIPPASLTKLMTLHLAHKRIAAGALKKDEKVNIHPEAWAAKMQGSSVMFLEPGQNVTVAEIMKGIAVPSGNDASVAIAQHMAGTVDAFVAMMNKESQDMGFKMKFADPAGLSPQNMVTAREFAQFSRQYVTLHPEALAELHSVVEFTYPKAENLPKNTQSVTQYNRNQLLGTIGVDGLKTGFIEESGYNIALTAKQGEMRLVAVILGVEGRNEAEGSAKRSAAGQALLQWGFANFTTVKPAVPAAQPVRVYKGAGNEVALQPAHPLVLTIEKDVEKKVSVTVQQQSTVIAPVKKGQKLGEIFVTAEGKELYRIDLVAAADVVPGGFFKRLWDTIRLWVAGLF
jgi:D-alanyl-D-alanine carboxypeptidase (penicillin-binding protein 5/6)